jgi:hypothetical protein
LAGRCRRHNSLPCNPLAYLACLGTSRAPHRAMIRFRYHSLPRFVRLAMPAVAGLIVSASLAEAQRPVPVSPRTNPTQQRGRDQIVPRAFYPPAGMCRIWINEVPAGQQPAPTDCASAVRNRPANGKVLFGDDPAKGNKPKTEKSKSSPTDELVDLINRRIKR